MSKVEKNHPCFLVPDNENQKLWRYISLPKFLDLLQRQALYFSRADLLGDPFEGSAPKRNAMRAEEIITAKKSGIDVGFWQKMEEDQIQRMFQMMSDNRKTTVSSMFVNCWHQNEQESAAMWKLYSSGEPILAIETSYSKLRSALPAEIYMGKIKYIDYETEEIPEDMVFYPIVHKRKSFEHENELRAVVWDTSVFDKLNKKEELQKGAYIPIKPEQFIQAVYVDPNALDWFRDVIVNVCKNANLDCPINHSDLAKGPVF